MPSRPHSKRIRLTFLVCLLLLTAAGLAFHRPATCWWYLKCAERDRDEIRLREAAEYARAAVELAPDDFRPLLLLSQLERMQDQLEESAGTLDTAAEKGCPESLLQMHRWLIVARGGNTANAGWQLPRLLASDQMDERDVSEAFVIGFTAMGQFDRAVPFLDAWELDFPNDYRPAAHRAIMARMKSQWDDAVQYYEQAVALGDPRSITRLRQGECLLEANDPAAAADLFRAALTIDAECGDCWLGLARAALQLGEDSAARSALDECLALDPLNFDAALAVAKLDLEAGNTDDAIRQFETLLAAWPEDARTLYEYGKALERVNRASDAAAALSRWKRADQEMQEVERQIILLQQSPTDLQLRTEIGLRLMKHYSRQMGLQYLLAVVQADWSQKEAHAMLARYFEWRKDDAAAEMHRTAAE